MKVCIELKCFFYLTDNDFNLGGKFITGDCSNT